MAKTVYNCGALTGGASRALDALAVASLTDLDRAIVLDASDNLMFFEFQAAATDAENTATHPYRVRPDDYSSAGVWYEQEVPCLREDGTLALSGDWDIGDGRKIEADKIAARDGDGLSLVDDGDNGIVIADGGGLTLTPLTADWDIGDGRKIEADKIAARDGDGLYLVDDGDNGIFVNDGGVVDMSKQSACKAHLAGAQTIPTGTFTKLELATEDYDAQAEFDNAVNYRFTAANAGTYLIVGNVSISALDSGNSIAALIKKNGATSVGEVTLGCVANASTLMASVSCVVALAATDYVELYVYHNYGNDRTAAADAISNNLAVHKLA